MFAEQYVQHTKYHVEINFHDGGNLNPICGLSDRTGQQISRTNIAKRLNNLVAICWCTADSPAAETARTDRTPSAASGETVASSRHYFDIKSKFAFAALWRLVLERSTLKYICLYLLERPCKMKLSNTKINLTCSHCHCLAVSWRTTDKDYMTATRSSSYSLRVRDSTAIWNPLSYEEGEAANRRIRLKCQTWRPCQRDAKQSRTVQSLTCTQSLKFRFPSFPLRGRR